jgi:hypothetical protein
MTARALPCLLRADESLTPSETDRAQELSAMERYNRLESDVNLSADLQAVRVLGARCPRLPCDHFTTSKWHGATASALAAPSDPSFATRICRYMSDLLL